MAELGKVFGDVLQGKPLDAAGRLLSGGNDAEIAEYLASYEDAMAKQAELYGVVREKKEAANRMKSILSLATSVTEKVS